MDSLTTNLLLAAAHRHLMQAIVGDDDAARPASKRAGLEHLQVCSVCTLCTKRDPHRATSPSRHPLRAPWRLPPTLLLLNSAPGPPAP